MGANPGLEQEDVPLLVGANKGDHRVQKLGRERVGKRVVLARGIAGLDFNQRRD